MSPSVILFSSCPPSFPSSRFFPISQLFPSGGQSIETSASASVFFIEYSGLISFRMDWFDRSPCSPRDSQVSSPTSQLKGINSLSLSFLWRRQWQPTPVCLPGKSHGWRSLIGYSPWGCRELDTTERLHFPLLYC